MSAVTETVTVTEEKSGPLGSLQYLLAVIFVVGWSAVICGGFAVQFIDWEYPCPLCMLQRMFMVLAALGGAFIVRKGMNGVIVARDYAVGWGLAIIGCVGGGFTAWRQTMLHILPGDPGYGGAVLGLHLYVWALVLYIAAIATIGVVTTFSYPTAATVIPPALALIGKLALWFCGLVIAANLVVVFGLEGLHWKLPDDPACYRLFYDLGILDGGCVLPPAG
ncbi:disulfide bond formation protein B [Nocardia sp. NPDC059195]|uniref:disulfide bond formation protein B n=1 Tax=Nocardia sp. NPDC059195 TaxID=3346765 RepID=UPI00369E866B